MTSLELLQEIDAWLSFNNSPSKEQISELQNDIKKHISEQLRIHDVSDSLPIEFLEWTEKGMWTKWESRNDGYHEMTGWYNTHNFAAMKQPLSSQKLFELFMLERSKQ